MKKKLKLLVGEFAIYNEEGELLFGEYYDYISTRGYEKVDIYPSLETDIDENKLEEIRNNVEMQALDFFIDNIIKFGGI